MLLQKNMPRNPTDNIDTYSRFHVRITDSYIGYSNII